MLKRIDIDGVFKAKNPSLYKALPRFLFSYVKRIVHQDTINGFLERHQHEYGFDFVHAIVSEFGIGVKAIGTEHLPASGGCIVAANHPLGALDAMALLEETGKRR